MQLIVKLHSLQVFDVVEQFLECDLYILSRRVLENLLKKWVGNGAIDTKFDNRLNFLPSGIGRFYSQLFVVIVYVVDNIKPYAMDWEDLSPHIIVRDR